MKKKLVYIVSSPRSGSTLLVNLLGNHTDMLNVGEIHNLHDFLNDGRQGRYFAGLCSCGSPIRECDLWGSAIKSVKSKYKISDSKLYTRAPIRRSRLFDYFNPSVDAKRLVSHVRHSNRHALVAKHCFSLMDELLATSKASVIVDSSKCPMHLAGYLAHRPKEWDIFVIHVVRDPCATVISMKKGKRAAGMKEPSFFRCALGWSHQNMLVKSLCEQQCNSSYTRIWHEDLCARGSELLDELLEDLGLHGDVADLFDYKKVRHDIGGSQSVSRERKRIEIQYDLSWLSEMTTARFLIDNIFARNVCEKLRAKR